MLNLTCAFSQSELGKYFEWIIICLNFTIQPFNISELFPIYDALNKKLGTCLDGVFDDKNEVPAI